MYYVYLFLLWLIAALAIAILFGDGVRKVNKRTHNDLAYARAMRPAVTDFPVDHLDDFPIAHKGDLAICDNGELAVCGEAASMDPYGRVRDRNYTFGNGMKLVLSAYQANAAELRGPF